MHHVLSNSAPVSDVQETYTNSDYNQLFMVPCM